MSESHKLPADLFTYLVKPTPHALCLGLVACPAFCLEACTTGALLVAEGESAEMLRPELALRLRAEIVRRHLMVPRSPDIFRRLDEFLARFPGEGGPLRDAVRHESAALREGTPRPSGIWTGSGQNFVREMLREYEATDSFVRTALLGLLLPEEGTSFAPDERKNFTISLSIVVSIRSVVELLHPDVRSVLRRGLCLRLTIEHDERAGVEKAEVKFLGSPAGETLARSAETALAQVQSSEELDGRLLVSLPDVLRYVPVDGNSAALAFYWAFLNIARNRRPPADCAVTGGLDAQSGWVAEVGELPEKAEAAREAGLSRLFLPLFDRESTNTETLVGIPGREPGRFVQEVRRRSSPSHVMVAGLLKAAVFVGLCVLAVPLAPHLKFFAASAAGVDAWTDGHIPSPLLHGVVYAAIAFPLQILLILEPFLVFLLAFGVLANQIDCLVNWLKFRQWEPGLSAAGPDSSLLRHRRTPAARAIRTAVYFFLISGFWIVGVGALALWYGLIKMLPSAPPGAGAGRWALQIAIAIGMFAFLFVIIGGVARVYRAVGRWMRRFSILK